MLWSVVYHGERLGSKVKTAGRGRISAADW